MFIWVTQGLVEPYIPKVKPDSIKRVHPLHAGIPDKPIEVGEQVDMVEIKHYKGGSTASANVADFYSQEETKPKDDRKLIFYAKDIMSTKLQTISPNDLILEVERLFHTHRFRHMPVIDSSSHLQGILSERDLLKFTIDTLRDPELESKKERVEDIMQTKILSAFPETPIREIARIMFEEKIGCVPILDKKTNLLVGIVTRSDILRKVMNNPPLDIYT